MNAAVMSVVLGPQPVLLARAHQYRREQSAGSHVERADPLGRVELVASEGQQVDPQLLHVDRDFADRLCGIGMERHCG